MELISKSFASQCMAFPARVDEALATISTVEGATDMLAKAQAMSTYAEELKAGIDIERPIAIGVLKIKAKIGELCAAKTAKEYGAMKGEKGIDPGSMPFSSKSLTAFRKLAKAKERLDEYYEATDDVPTQAGFIAYASGVHVGKASGENEWYTPVTFLAAAREVMDGIDLDPASCEKAQENVQAARFYTIDDDGLSQVWNGNVWMNPPYSKELCEKFVSKLIEHFKSGDVTQACVLVNNATETGWGCNLLKHCSAVCFPAGRIKFLGKNGQPANSPLQGQMLAYFGDETESFAELFSGFGTVLFQRQ
jgi:hypothetical protein